MRKLLRLVSNYRRQFASATIVFICALWLVSSYREPLPGFSSAAGGSMALASGHGAVWALDPMIRVGRTDKPGPVSTVELYAARGEYAPFQVIVQGPQPGPVQVQIAISELIGPGDATIPYQAMTLHQEEYVEVRRSSPDHGRGNRPLGTGWYPDPLLPLASGPELAKNVSVQIPGGVNTPFWLDLLVPRSAVPGLYRGTVDVTGKGVYGRVYVRLTVWDFTLPIKPSLRSSFGIHGPRLGDKNTHELLLRHKLMPLVVRPEHSRDLGERLGLTTTALSFWSHSNRETCTMDPAPPVPAISEAMKRYPSGIDLYVYVADEVEECVGLYPQLKEWARNVHQAGAKTLVTITPTPQLYDSGGSDARPAVDIWVVLPVMHEQAPDRIADAQARSLEVWSYNALSQDTYSPKWAIDHAPGDYRIQPGFLSQSLGYRGILYWSVDNWTPNPWYDVITHTEGSHAFPGEGMLIYPPRGTAGPVPSLRLKWLREGVEDFEYVEILKARGKGGWALQVARSVGRDWRNWTPDPSRIEAARRQLGEEIDRLSGISRRNSSKRGGSRLKAGAI